MEPLLKAIVRVQSYSKPVDFLKPFVDKERQASVGSGTFVDPAVLGYTAMPDTLYILTCAHVIDNSDQVTVTLPLKGSEQLEASVLAFVPKHNYDLAIVALPNPQGRYNRFVNWLPIGSSKQLQQGEKLMALGFPMGQTGLKVSDGVFAGLQHYLQHTVSISPGNSGGPLINSSGELVGINNAGLVHVAASNIGYAVPIEFYTLTAKRFFSVPLGPPSPERIFRKPNFGFFLQPTTLEHVQQLAVVSPQNCCSTGVFIYEVVPGSPAHAAGIMPGDFLCAVDGVPVDLTGDIRVEWSLQKVSIQTALERLSDPEQSYGFTIWSQRTRRCENITLTPKVLDSHAHFYLYSPFDTVKYVNVKGFVIMPLCRNHQDIPETVGAFLGLKPVKRYLPHLIITHVVPGSPADLSKTLEVGELLTHVNNQRVQSVNDVEQALLHSPLAPNVLLQTKKGKTTVI